jgi:hypothetical protein
MPRSLTAQAPKIQEPSFQELWQPVENILDDLPLPGESKAENEF